MKKKHIAWLLLVSIAVVLLLVAMPEKSDINDSPGVYYEENSIYVNIEEEFYQYDCNGEWIGSIPVKFKGWLKRTTDARDFDGIVEVQNYELQYVENSASEDHITYAVMLDDTENGYVHLHIYGMKVVTEATLAKYLHSDYKYNITLSKGNPQTIVVRVGRLVKTAIKSGGWNIDYPTQFYAVLAESQEAAAQLIAPEIAYLESASKEAGTAQ